MSNRLLHLRNLGQQPALLVREHWYHRFAIPHSFSDFIGVFRAINVENCQVSVLVSSAGKSTARKNVEEELLVLEVCFYPKKILSRLIKTFRDLTCCQSRSHLHKRKRDVRSEFLFD